jgi:uncharacterized Zn finger protein (UPF0148 family)
MDQETQAQIFVPKFESECSISKGVEISDLLKVKKEAILYVQPCTSERGKLMADVELGHTKSMSINPATLCSLLEMQRRRFSELKCSPHLGVAKFKWKGREMSIFKNGKIKIQRALDRDEILRIANSVARLVWGAVICDVCGMPTLRCASGECGKCITKAQKTEIEKPPNAAPLIEGYSNLKKFADEISKLEKEGQILHPQEDLEKYLQTTRYLALFFATEAAKKDDAALGLILLGEAEKANKDYRSLKSKLDGRIDTKS